MDVVVLIVAGVVILLVLYVYARFSYSVERGNLVIRWRVLGVPFNRRRIDVDRISEIRRFDWRGDLFPGFEVWGTPLRGEPWIVVLSSGLLRKLYITPPDPNGLRTEISTEKAKRQDDFGPRD